ncbi:MAG: rRNA maturation RNase YbeY, partial [Chthoniobacterales bacterium]
MPVNLEVRNRQRRVRVDVCSLQDFAERALRECLRTRGGLSRLRDITAVLVSDRKISELHRRYMKIAGATDVITFQHGDIFISTETARRQATQFGTTTLDEIKLYLVHGLLHLHGFDDKTPAAARRMARMQERIVRRAG